MAGQKTRLRPPKQDKTRQSDSPPTNSTQLNSTLVNKFFIMVFLCWWWRRHFRTVLIRAQNWRAAAVLRMPETRQCNGAGRGWPTTKSIPNGNGSGPMPPKIILPFRWLYILLWDLFSYKLKHTHRFMTKTARRVHERIIYFKNQPAPSPSPIESYY